MLRLREALPGDIADIHRLLCILEDRYLPRTCFDEIYAQMLSDQRNLMTVADLDGVVVGLIDLRVEWQLHHCAQVAEILEFCVDTNLRRLGIGRRLFEEACALARKRGCMLIEVASCVSRVDAHRFYKRAGMSGDHLRFTMQLNADSELI